MTEDKRHAAALFPDDVTILWHGRPIACNER